MTPYFILLHLLTILPLFLSEDVVVKTKNGSVRGKRVSTGQGNYTDLFFGIPFALPPVGPLRFTAPKPAGTWTGTRDATRFPNICPQLPPAFHPLGLPTSEDCLYLNIYSPKPPSDSSLLPVMFWIHGGAYKTGTASYFNGTELAKTGVVVVTTNYRLGALGFLSTQDASSPGNFGLLDQILALKWVKDNIAMFHGNPNDVTIFGESAGSGSVALLRLSPLAQGLFSRAIMESGASLSPWAIARPATDSITPVQFTESLGKELGCGDADVHSSSELVQCLRAKSVDSILEATEIIYKTTSLIKFRPTVESILGVIPKDPAQLLMAGVGSDVTSIRGVNKNEYTLFLLKFPLEDFTLEKTKVLIEVSAKEFFPGNSQTVASKLISYYITAKNLTTPEQCRDAFAQIQTDFDFIVPTIVEEYYSSKFGRSRQYLYEFTYRATHSTRPAWAGVMHGSELPFVFGQPFSHDKFFSRQFPYNWTSQDMEVSRNMITMWTNFAKYGDPTPESVGGVRWTPYSLDSQSYLDIGSSLSVNNKLAADRVQFWLSIYDHTRAQ